MMSTEDSISDNTLHFTDENIGEHISLVLDGEVVSSDDSGSGEQFDDIGNHGSTTITVSSSLSPLRSSPIIEDDTMMPSSLSNATTTLCNIEPSVTSTVTSLANSPLILNDANMGDELTVCQYIIPGDILAVNGMEEVVQGVELVKQWNLNTSLASTSTHSGETLQLLSTGDDQEDVLFTVVDDSTPVIHLDTSKTILETVPLPNDLVIEKYYQYGSDVRLVDDAQIEAVKLKDVDLNSSSIINTSTVIKEEMKSELEVEDIKDPLDISTYETKRLSDMVSGQVMEINPDSLETFKTMINEDAINYESLPVVSDTFSTLPEQENNANNTLYPNIVLGYIEGGQPGKTVRLKVHKVTRSDKTNKLETYIPATNNFKEEVFRCKECGVYFKKNEDLKAHMEAHLVKRQNSCALCNVEFPSKSALQMHIKQHFSKTHSCELCSERFASKGLLRTHKLRKHSNNVGTITSSNDTRVNGVTLVNSQQIQHQHTINGTIVAKTKVSPNNSIPNNAVDNNNLIRVFKCSLCEAVFASRSAMKQHSTSHHHKPYKCDQCGATFTQNGSLQVHIRRHRGEKPFTCSLCGNSYTRAFSLKVHMKTHTGEKPHMCEFCSSSFITSSHLNVHRRIHTGERPFSCSECSATFITTSHLNVHKKIHLLSNTSPVRCQHCSETFKDSTQLRLHRKVHHAHLNMSKKRKVSHAAGCRCKDCRKLSPNIVTTTTLLKEESVSKILKSQLSN